MINIHPTYRHEKIKFKNWNKKRIINQFVEFSHSVESTCVSHSSSASDLIVVESLPECRGAEVSSILRYSALLPALQTSRDSVYIYIRQCQGNMQNKWGPIYRVGKPIIHLKTNRANNYYWNEVPYLALKSWALGAIPKKVKRKWSHGNPSSDCERRESKRKPVVRLVYSHPSRLRKKAQTREET